MTVYNITKLSPNTARAIAKYYGVNKVSLRYSDWGNKFGAVVINKIESKNIPVNKRLIVGKYLITKFGSISINILKSYPRIKRKK